LANDFDFEFIEYRKADGIAYVTMNRPEVRNALHAPACHEMDRAWKDFENDPEMRVGIVTGGDGPSFCAGLDLGWSLSQRRGIQGITMPDTGFGGLTNPRHNKLTKPIIAAVNGYCIGGGLEIAMSSDVIIASDTAQFGLPEAKRGIVAGAGGPYRLTRQIPFRIALGYMMTGRYFDAEEAYRWGLVNAVVPKDDVMSTAEEWAAEIKEGAPLSIVAMRQMAIEGMEMTLEDAYHKVFSGMQAVRGSQDSKEGLAAFKERRKPNWTGK
jgi:dehydration protein DpgD